MKTVRSLLGGTAVYSVTSYNAAGAPLATSYGNGMTGSYSYNNQLQLNSIQYGSASTQLMSLTYNYGGALDNREIQEITDKSDSFSQRLAMSMTR